MKKSLVILLLVALFVGSALQAQDVAKPALRTWKDSTGQFSIQAVFVRVNGDQVVLQGTDKKEISLPLAQLSAADQQYVKARLTPAKPEPQSIPLPRLPATGRVVKSAKQAKLTAVAISPSMSDHWSFQQLTSPAVPVVRLKEWGRDDLDHFILEKLEQAKLQPNPDADRYTLIVWGGEFGRSPNPDNNGGRNHNNKGFTMWMAGGGVKGGFRFGSTDELGRQAVDGKMGIHDLHATILHLLGLDHEQLTYNYSGRDFRLTDTAGSVARDILA